MVGESPVLLTLRGGGFRGRSCGGRHWGWGVGLHFWVACLHTKQCDGPLKCCRVSLHRPLSHNTTLSPILSHNCAADFPRPGNRSGELMTAEEFLCIVGYQSEQGGGKRARGDYD